MIQKMYKIQMTDAKKIIKKSYFIYKIILTVRKYKEYQRKYQNTNKNTKIIIN
jgi:hypothetical protein